MSDHTAHLPGAPMLDIDRLGMRYGPVVALDAVSFRVERGQRVAVVGPNGAGKTTLFKAIAGLEPPSSGTVRIAGSEPGRHLCIAYVPQRAAVDWSFPITVLDAVLMARARALGWGRRPGAADRKWAEDCLASVGLDALARRQIGELSGGQQQRMFLARALAQRAELMLMDEPTGGLDAPSQRDLLRLIEALSPRQVTVLIATHDFDLAARADTVLLLHRRLLAHGPPETTLAPDRLAGAFGGRAGAIAAGHACEPEAGS
jgi:ABC-type Mn2+/Zn2+ transport system ATPase subunit